MLGVSGSGYYDLLRRAPSERAIAKVVLTEAIRKAYQASGAIRAELQDAGNPCDHGETLVPIMSARLTAAPTAEELNCEDSAALYRSLVSGRSWPKADPLLDG